jgi:hypothetical protein
MGVVAAAAVVAAAGGACSSIFCWLPIMVFVGGYIALLVAMFLYLTIKWLIAKITKQT